MTGSPPDTKEVNFVGWRRIGVVGAAIASDARPKSMRTLRLSYRPNTCGLDIGLWRVDFDGRLRYQWNWLLGYRIPRRITHHGRRLVGLSERSNGMNETIGQRDA